MRTVQENADEILSLFENRNSRALSEFLTEESVKHDSWSAICDHLITLCAVENIDRRMAEIELVGALRLREAETVLLNQLDELEIGPLSAALSGEPSDKGVYHLLLAKTGLALRLVSPKAQNKRIKRIVEAYPNSWISAYLSAE